MRQWFLFFFGVLSTGCISGRSASEGLELARATQTSWPSRSSPEVLQAAVERAAGQMELSTEQKSKRVGEPWIFHRGIRLVDPALWWFVIIEPNPNAPGHALITVGGAPVYRAYTNTGETISKGGELTLRIIRVAMAGSK